MRLKPKNFRKNNYFILYDENDEIICYFDNFNELKEKHLKKYRPNMLADKFNKSNSNIITVIVDNKKLKLATFC